jgi:cytochrome c556
MENFKDFQAFYGEMKRRAVKQAADAGTGNLRKTSLSYGRVLKACATCHTKFRG